MTTAKLLLFLFVLFVFSFIRPSTALALNACKGIQVTATPPGALYNNSSNATLTIDVDGTAGYKSWKVEFLTAPSLILPASIKNGTNISITIDNSFANTYFYPGPHKLETIAVKNDGTEVKVCEANYNVLDANNQCKLEIDPVNGITPLSNVKVSASNLNQGVLGNAGYAFFFDENLLYLNATNNNMRDLQIPSSFLTPTLHTISIRYPQVSSALWDGIKKAYGIINPVTTLNTLTNLTNVTGSFSPPFCSISFTVGTPNNPGSVINQSSGGVNVAAPKPCTGDGCTIAAGKSCGDDKTNPSILTAIGCIHTNPVSFTGDLLKFLTAIGGGFAFLLMLLGAFQMISSAGNPETLQAGRDRFTSALIGLLLVIFAVLLMKIIGVDILCIPGFDARCK